MELKKGIIKGYSFPKGFVECNGKEYLFSYSQVIGSISNNCTVNCEIKEEKIINIYEIDVKKVEEIKEIPQYIPQKIKKENKKQKRRK